MTAQCCICGRMRKEDGTWTGPGPVIRDPKIRDDISHTLCKPCSDKTIIDAQTKVIKDLNEEVKQLKTQRVELCKEAKLWHDKCKEIA